MRRLTYRDASPTSTLRGNHARIHLGECLGQPRFLGSAADGEHDPTAACPEPLPPQRRDSSVSGPTDSAHLPVAIALRACNHRLSWTGCGPRHHRRRRGGTDAATPQVGRRAPNLTLTDTRGEKIRLSDLKGEKHVPLVFKRGFV
jgi:hypothetical protein